MPLYRQKIWCTLPLTKPILILHFKLNKAATILVTGANGQLGQAFVKLSQQYPQYNFFFATKDILAIDKADAVTGFFATHTIDYCINCAAYTAVDKAETDSAAAFAINADAVGHLAAVCNKHNVPLIHFSTDYVFDGSVNTAYVETATTNPQNVYGRSKLKGEELALQNHSKIIIIRTSWVYAATGHNFVKTMLRLMQEREQVSVVNDQFGSPTYATDLALVVMQIITQLPKFNYQQKIFHYSNDGNISWYDFALAIKNYSNSNCNVLSIATAQYPTPAKRPQYSVLHTGLICKTFHLQTLHWKKSLQKCIEEIIQR
jgi:dTDP-4-dehydrorhamnose reductase